MVAIAAAADLCTLHGCRICFPSTEAAAQIPKAAAVLGFLGILLVSLNMALLEQ